MGPRWLAGAVVVVVVGLFWVMPLPGRDGAFRTPASRPSDAIAGSSGTARATKPAAPRPTGSLRIQGVVRDARGPVRGVRVSASRVDAETLSERPCPGEGEATMFDERLLDADCLLDREAEVAGLVELREGEAPVFAETTTAEDGAFVLQGLPPGAFTLWALGEHGAVMRPRVPAGGDAVELLLEQGFQLSGVVTAQDGRTPLPGARVTVLHEAHTRFFDALADAQGRFRVGPLPPGRYLEVASARGWRPGLFREALWLDADVEVVLTLHRMERLEGQVFTPQGLPAGVVTVNLHSGIGSGDVRSTRSDAQGRFTFEEVPDVEHRLWAWDSKRTAYGDAIAQPSLEQAFIRMKPTTFLEGTVRDEQGRPLDGVRLSAQGMVLGDAPSPEAVTDMAGHYRLGPVLASELKLSLTRAHFLNRTEHVSQQDASAHAWDFTLSRAVSVEGLVVDTEGRPLAGVTLRLAPGSDPSIYINRDRAAQQDENTVSDEAGRFLLETAGEGPARLWAGAADFMPEKVSVKVPATGLRVVLRRGASVSGTVLDAKGQPMPSVEVQLWNMAPGSGEARAGTVDAAGGFSLRGLKAGRYALEALRGTPGLEQSASSIVELGEHTQAVVSLRFEEGRTLEGMTVDTEGHPVPDVQVRACLPLDDVPAWQLSAAECGPRGTGVRSGADGRFVLKHLVAPTYQLVAWKEGRSFTPARSRGGKADASSLHVAPGGSDVRLVLERSPHLRARVVSADGAPLPASLWAPVPMPVSSPDGVFDVALGEDARQVLFRAKGFLDLRRDVVMRPGVDLDLGTLVMIRGRKARVIVRDEAHPGPLAGVKVIVDASYEGTPPPDAPPVPLPFIGSLDGEGAVELDGLPLVPVVLTVSLLASGRNQGVTLLATHQETATVTLPAP
ncbi:carboxypeptidase regulatory-like domain-containing protein [Corallococcus sp. ZKHCc1 1396]|uniref:Carboxypeptidase regulatory-like domain-containing protein n=1 Tax=Corallococcus soli TaxID=2710757 RepID=A0ABR9PJ39_9BACT|nr:carboxypeptidase-like regulatory domain-containing protein [Corallococcus soli]MBE4747943.1 carboxypeptidase regulatory-like domain-containing protein [Corallococcus soli]